MKKGPAGNYARAVLASVDDPAQFEQELEVIQKAFVSNPEILSFFETPLFSKDQKKEILSKTLSGKISTAAESLLNILVDKKRERFLSSILEAIRSINDETLGRVRAELFVAAELDESSRNALVERAKEIVSSHRRHFGLTREGSLDVKVEYRVKKDIVAGVVLKVGDYLIDATVKTYLRNWKERVYTRKIDPSLGWSKA